MGPGSRPTACHRSLRQIRVLPFDRQPEVFHYSKSGSDDLRGPTVSDAGMPGLAAATASVQPGAGIRSRSTAPWFLCALIVLSSLSGCASGGGPYQLDLMPAPDVYDDGNIDPFVDNAMIQQGVQPDILFATDRLPATPDDKDYDHYTNTPLETLNELPEESSSAA